MQLSLTTLAFAFISIVSARDLSIAKKDSKQVTIKSKGTGEVLWFSLSISNGVPLFEIKGSEKDDESGAKANVQLALEDFNEQGAKKCLSLAGTQGYWSDINVEQVGEDSKKPNQVILRSTMTHQDKDIAGNYFVLALEASIDKDGDAFEIRQQIQNFPYTDGKGVLDAGQLISSSHKGNAKKDASKITLASGGLAVIADSAIEDGTPTTIKAVRMDEAKGAPRSGLCEQSKRAHVEFGAVRPKNATYSERLVFYPNSIKIVQEQKPDTKGEPKDHVKGMTLNGAAPSGAISLGLGASLLALFGLLA
ncbi:hypothetical protein PSACC_01292 [Paramicrosporidium saccamoebae]|uniref:Uncharacterized protein n=1 Tax=Paramicrosporidium saccamoebae TaxID=1246581 RepID=A0A2H9TMA3_9FUNG|nr:hypothetical protein PSACC_01292 [Paramicrosporidium saccamoebae]